MKIKDILTINNSKNLMVINAKMDTIRFCTERLTIRQFCEKDADSYFRLLSHPRVHCFADEKLESIEEAKDQILKKKDRISIRRFVIELRWRNKMVLYRHLKLKMKWDIIRLLRGSRMKKRG